ncbi:hypothetical protein ABZP36_007151 [Zizania latifolia]
MSLAIDSAATASKRQAELLKQEGNAAFKKDRISAAIDAYTGDTVDVSAHKSEWSDSTQSCLLKIYGIKTLVKSYLPCKDAQAHPRIEKLMGILKNILTYGDISPNMVSSTIDKAHLRLAAAKAILRSSRQWDHKVPVDMFCLTLRTSHFKHNLIEERGYILDQVTAAKEELRAKRKKELKKDNASKIKSQVMRYQRKKEEETKEMWKRKRENKEKWEETDQRPAIRFRFEP